MERVENIQNSIGDKLRKEKPQKKINKIISNFFIVNVTY